MDDIPVWNVEICHAHILRAHFNQVIGETIVIDNCVLTTDLYTH